MFWVDETIDEVIERKDKKYLVTDYKTPSGVIHVGALRGVVIHDVIFRGIKEKKEEVEYWYGFDDLDSMDGISKDLEKDFGQYMGVPLCNIPSPKPGHNNFARFFADSFIKVFQSMGVKAKIVWASELYRSGVYNKAIETVLNNSETIRRIYKEVSGGEKPKDWYPIQVICPKCGKLGTTKVFGWDGKEVEFKCEENMVEWAKGCGYVGKSSPYDGNGKMPYKVETAAKWFTFGTSVELAGKDHYTKGGTFYIAREIAKEVFNISAAYGYGYEWFLVGGKKMSSSKGIGSSAEEIAAILPPEMLRFLMVRTRAKRAIDFDPEGDTIPLLYDEYDRCINEFLNNPQADLARAFYYTETNLEKELPTYFLRFSKVAYMLQMPRVDIFQYAESEKGLPLTQVEIQEIEKRVEVAKNWLDKFAPESFKFIVCEELPEVAKSLSEVQKEFLAKTAELIEKKEVWQGEELHREIHDVKNEAGINPRDAFSAIYLTFLGKDSGPQAGWLLASLDKGFVTNRLKEVSK